MEDNNIGAQNHVAPGDSTVVKASYNSVALLIGLSILSAPYAIHKAGYFGILLNVVVPVAYWCAAYFMARCMDLDNTLEDYKDLAGKALSKWGRRFVTILFYIELMGNLVSNSISIADTLVYMFPEPHIGFAGVRGRNFLIALATLGIVPTVWFKKLSSISYLSLMGMICVCINTICLVYVGFREVGFSKTVPGFQARGIPAALGVYAFSYAGIPIYPIIYKSMNKPSQFPKVLMVGFMVAIGCHFLIGITGVVMFGTETKQQIHMNLPRNLIACKIAAWTTVLLPMTKFTLVIAPIAEDLEQATIHRFLPLENTPQDQFSKAPSSRLKPLLGLIIRLLLLVLVVLISLYLPYFSIVIELVGSLVSITLCMILPYMIYLRLVGPATKLEETIIWMLVCMGAAGVVWGTTSSAARLVSQKRLT